MIYEQGDIISLNFDPSQCHGPAGRHYAVVISPRHINRICALTLLVPITSRDNGYPLHVKITEGNAIGGFAQCEALRSVDLGARFFASGVEKIGELDDGTLADILARILVFMGIEPL